MALSLTRRTFCVQSMAAAIAARSMMGQSAMESVAAIERARVLAEAVLDVDPKNAIEFSARVAVLTAAFVLTSDEAYAGRARELLNTWLLASATKLAAPAKLGVVGLIPLAEVAVALRFLVDFLDGDTLSALKAAFKDAQEYLQTDHEAMLARERSDLRGAAWLLESAAFARLLQDETALIAARRWFRQALRKQVSADGTFPEEIASPNPLRNTLLHFDLLMGACQLLSTPFDKLWDMELMDGPGLRVVVAWLYPRINDLATWSAVADAQYFRSVPLRRPGLLFCGRAYNRPEYVELWKSEPAEVPGVLAASVPIREPLLWVTRAAHGL
ncbi:Alginate lyase [Bryocella elongata]|uniref:Alginate lyase n=1 Tax=Bryocella elongata TaxID=863522 RepID=A0A1H6B3B6_9BACT|nr:alginate lyase family protein [Bryocella elongata]SEG55341.1 Alginate lyase [Bryocella elongata]